MAMLCACEIAHEGLVLQINPADNISVDLIPRLTYLIAK